MTFRRVAATLATLTVLTLPAFAHARPKLANPAANSTVNAADVPKEISIVFTEAVDPKFSSIQLLDAKGTPMATPATVADPADHAHLSLPIPHLAPGSYGVHWVTAAVDGHHLDGTYTFTVK